MYTWSTLSIETITNLYLYGQEDTPSLYEERLRSLDQYNALEVDDEGNQRLRIVVDAKSYMEEGAGRYAHASEIKFVKDFFEETINLSEGVYTKAQLQNLGFSSTDFNLAQTQSNIDTDSADYGLRTYIYNKTSVTVASDTRFVVAADGTRSVENLALLPFDDNFDFTSNNPLAILGNPLLKDEIDPFDIGRQIYIDFEGKDDVIRIDDYDYQQDVIDAANIDYDLFPTNLLSEMQAIVAQLKVSGTIEYLTSENKNVIYGSAENDNLEGNDDEEDIIVLGDGDDTINSSSGNDLIYGGGDTDTINYQNLSGQSITVTKSLSSGFEWDAITNGGELDKLKDIEKFILTELNDVVYINAEDIQANLEFDGKGQEENEQDILSFENSTQSVEIGNTDSVEVKYKNFESVVGTDYDDTFSYQSLDDLGSGVTQATHNIDAKGGEDTIDFSAISESLSVHSEGVDEKNINFLDIEKFNLSAASDIFVLTSDTADNITSIDAKGHDSSEGDILDLSSFTSTLEINNNSIDNLDIKIQGFESILLGSGDDEVGSLTNKILITGSGNDEVEVGTNVYIADASLDDRILYSGSILTGSLKGKESDSQWGVGKFGEEYSINTQGDLVIWTPNMRDENGDKYFTFVANYHSAIEPGYDSSTANITLGEIEVKSSLFFRDNEGISIDDVKNTWSVIGDVTKANTGENGITGKDPLVLDLDDDGIELTQDIYFAGKFFDLNGDGFAERTGWVDGDDGLLAIDTDGNGQIDDISELFGSPDETGFNELAALDSNSDGVIDANDTEFANLRVWQDANEDAITDAGELKTLGELGIVSLDVTPSNTTETQNNGNTIAAIGSYTKSDNSTGDIGEVLFEHNLYDSQWKGSVTISNDALALPKVNGHGTLTSLREAMSLDSNFAAIVQTAATSFNTPDLDALRAAILPLLNGWRAVDLSLPTNTPGMEARSDINIVVSNSSSTGATVEDFVLKKTDAQGDYYEFASGRDVLDTQGQVITRPTEADILAQTLNAGESWTEIKGEEIQFFERWLGIELTFGEESLSGQESIDATSYMLNLVWTQLNEIVVGIATQDGGLEQYFQGVVYHPEISKFTAVDNSDLAPVFEAIFNDAPGTAQGDTDYINSWKGFLNVVLNNFEREGNLTITHGYLFKNLVTAYENIGLSISLKQAAELFDIPASAITTANGQTDLGDQEDIVYLTTGNDVVSGGDGSDTYVIGQNFGNDSINSYEDTLGRGGYDTIRFAHLNVADVTVTRSGDNLIITENGTSNSLTIIDQFRGRVPGLTTSFIEGKYAVQEIVFSDGTVWNHWDMAYATHEVDPNNSIVIGTRTGDYLDGGAGDDILHGRHDGDVYYYGLNYGNDTIDDIGTTSFAGVDSAAYHPLLDAPDVLTLRNLKLEDIEFSRDSTSNSTLDDLIITVSATGETLKIVDQFWRSYGQSFGTEWLGRIEGFVLGDGLQLNADELMEQILEDATTAGNDTIYGFDYDDVLDGGAGDDYLSGGNDSDTYIFGLSYGNDTIFEDYGADLSDNIDALLFLPDVDHTTVTFDRVTASSEDLIFTLSDGSTIVVEDQFNQYSISGERNSVENFEFQDGSNITWDKDYIKQNILLADKTANDDTIYGFDGSGDTLDGGAGNDTLYGLNGGDTYIFGVGYGNDTIEDFSQAFLAGTDKVEFTGGLLSTDVNFTRDGDDIIAEIISTGETLRINKQFDSLGFYRVESYVFADVTLDYLEVRDLALEGNVIEGDGSDNTLNGTDGNDAIYGFAGNDIIDGGLGDDDHFGGDGNDTLIGNSGADNFDGGAGVDTLDFTYTSSDVDINLDTEIITFSSSTENVVSIENVIAGSGDNTITGNDASNEILSGSGDDTVLGGIGDDTLYGEGGSDDLFGGDGDDVLSGGLGNDSFDGGAGNDTADFTYSSSNADFDLRLSSAQAIFSNSTENLISIENIIGTSGNNDIWGDTQDNILDGYEGDDVIESGIGNDTLIGGEGNDILNGGNGIDRVDYSADIAAVTVNIHNGIATDGWGNTDTLSGIEDIVGSSYNDVLVGNHANSNTIWGGSGNDNIQGRNGGNVLYGEDGIDQVRGGSGNDTISGGSDNDFLYGHDGNDVLDGDDGNDRLYGHNDDDVLRGGIGVDFLYGGAGHDTLYGGDTEDRLYGEDGDDELYGENENDRLYGGAGDDLLVGDDNDPTTGNGGQDFLYGEDGNDTLYGGEFADYLYGQAGDDEIYGGTHNDRLEGGLGNDKLYGDEGSDFLYGDDGHDEIHGGHGGDTVQAGSGDDVIYGERNDDTLFGNTGNDTIYGGLHNDAMNGQDGDDILWGESGDDTLYGESGMDVLIGGSGLDFLYGGAGDGDKDVFGFTSDEDSFDRIYHFDLLTDEINITNMLTGYAHGTSDIDDFVLLVHAGSRFDVRVDVDGGADNFVNTARVLTDIDNNLTAQDLINSGALVANETL